MAKSSSIQKNKSRHRLIEKFIEKRKLLKSKVMDKSLSLEDRIKSQRTSGNLGFYKKLELYQSLLKLLR